MKTTLSHCLKNETLKETMNSVMVWSLQRIQISKEICNDKDDRGPQSHHQVQDILFNKEKDLISIA
jgi:hypothetical protein